MYKIYDVLIMLIYQNRPTIRLYCSNYLRIFEVGKINWDRHTFCHKIPDQDKWPVTRMDAILDSIVSNVQPLFQHLLRSFTTTETNEQGYLIK